KPKQSALSLDQPMGDNSEGDYLLEVADPESDPEDMLLKDVVDERIQCALERLPKDFRTAVLLCDVKGLSYEEIAEVMRTSIGTVRSRIHRGRKLLRKYMDSGNPCGNKALAFRPHPA